MNIPGVVAQHAIITDECRQNRGEMEAFDEAVRRLRSEYEKVLHYWPVGSGGKLHVALTVEYPPNVSQ